MSDDPLPLGKIIKSIKKKYDEDETKENWKVHGGTDEHGNHDMIISRDPNAWFIKSKAIDPYHCISFGSELNIKSLDDEINQEIGKKKFDPKETFHQLFGMAVPTDEREFITAAGLQKISKPEMNFIKTRVEEKYPNLNRELKKKVKTTWEKQFPERDNLYM